MVYAKLHPRYLQRLHQEVKTAAAWRTSGGGSSSSSSSRDAFPDAAFEAQMRALLAVPALVLEDSPAEGVSGRVARATASAAAAAVPTTTTARTVGVDKDGDDGNNDRDDIHDDNDNNDGYGAAGRGGAGGSSSGAGDGSDDIESGSGGLVRLLWANGATLPPGVWLSRDEDVVLEPRRALRGGGGGSGGVAAALAADTDGAQPRAAQQQSRAPQRVHEQLEQQFVAAATDGLADFAVHATAARWYPGAQRWSLCSLWLVVLVVLAVECCTRTHTQDSLVVSGAVGCS